MKKFLMATTMAAGFVLGQGLAHASGPTVLTPGAWVSDTVPAADTPSDNSPIILTVTSLDAFSITDAYLPGDVYQISEAGSLFATFETTFTSYPTYWSPGTSTTADSAWANNSFSHGQTLLGPGIYDITVEDTTCATQGEPGCPAGLFYRADVIATPEPASMAVLGAGLAGLGAFRRRWRKQRGLAAS